MVTRNKPAAKPKPRSTALFMRVARPDPPDARDRRYTAGIGRAPATTLFPAQGLAVRHQGDTMACTGFALSLVVEHLLRSAKRERAPAISPFMLYSMARRYDEFPGSVADKGSSLRGVLKGWFKHGACRNELFPGIEMPPASKEIADDWWFDAVKRPLGAYYRVDTQSIADLHAALNEVGILVASAECHSGWDLGVDQPVLKRRPTSFKNVWQIPVKGDGAKHPAHAFAIVGYNERGFLVQNSWGSEWGSHGYAILGYDDWLRNAMDCWVAQLGVVTQDHAAISTAISLRTDKTGRVALAASPVLRNRELSPFIVNLGSDGALSNSGVFRTQPDDVRALVDVHLAQARKAWSLEKGVVDVCLYVHGGLAGEESAADVAAQWITMLYDKKVFPIFLMWENDFFSRMLEVLKEVGKLVTPTQNRWDERLEQLLARDGTRLWSELKSNADAMSRYRADVPDDKQAGAVLLYRHFRQGVDAQNIRMHVVAHSAGSIVATQMIDRLVRDGLSFESVSFMAPAIRRDLFGDCVRPHLVSGAVKRYQQFHLTDHAEQDDGTCDPYRRSLLYLVSESFEGGAATPILGLEKYANGYLSRLPNATAFASPGAVSASTTHGGFDSDAGTRAQILKFIRGR